MSQIRKWLYFLWHHDGRLRKVEVDETYPEHAFRLEGRTFVRESADTEKGEATYREGSPK